MREKLRTLVFCLAVLLLAKGSDAQEEVDPKVAAEDPDFLIQGEFLGAGLWTDGKALMKFMRFQRPNRTLGAKPPEGAVVLFDGSNVDHFPGATLTEMKTLQAGCKTKDQYPIKSIHIEFRLSWKPKARGQARSNSGVFIDGLPEIQVLDSFGLEGKKNECGAFYIRREPDVNMCLPPLVWQTYDVEFSQPSPEENIAVTVKHNGVVIHENYDTKKKEVSLRGLSFQAHGNRVQYRNIWFDNVD